MSRVGLQIQKAQPTVLLRAVCGYLWQGDRRREEKVGSGLQEIKADPEQTYTDAT